MEHKEEFDIITINNWRCPDETGVPLITMPNIPGPLHALNPRTFMGQEEWDMERFRCYENANGKCQICDTPCERLQAHELFTYDFESYTGVFKRLVAVCDKCHRSIHSGRTATMVKEGDLSTDYYLQVLEHCFKLVHDYNEKHEAELRVYLAPLNMLEHPEIGDEVLRLIRKYDIKFYRPLRTKQKNWAKWKLLWGNHIVRSPYDSVEKWVKQMEIQKAKDYTRTSVVRSAVGV